MLIWPTLLLLGASPAKAERVDPVSVIGDSWACGLLAADDARIDVHCENGSTTEDWPIERVTPLKLHHVVYIQLGVNDTFAWLAEGKPWDSKLHPRHTADRIRKLSKWLEEQGHEVWVLDYEPFRVGIPSLLLANMCPGPKGHLPKKWIHLTETSYGHRALWLLYKGCHIADEARRPVATD